jgi:hypothetical protein
LEAQKAGLEGNGLPDEAARAAMASGNLSYLLSEQERKRKEADAKAVESQIAVGAALTEAYQDQVIAFELAEDDKQRRQDQKDVEALERQLAVAREQQRIIEQAAVDQEYRIAEKYRRMSEFYEKDAIAFKLAEDEKQRQADAKIVEETDAFTAAWKARQEQIDTAKRVEEGLANEALEKQMARWKAIQAMYDDIAAKEQEFQARFQATISGALSSLTSATGGVQGAFRSLLESFRSYAVQMATQAIMKIKAVEGAIKVIEAAVAGNPVLALLMLGGALLLGRGRSSSDNNAFEEQQAKWEESVSRISSTLRSAFSARTYGEYLKTFGDRLKETVVENLSKAFMESAAMKPMMERLTAMIQQATSDGVLSGGETDAIRLLYQQIAQMGGAFWKQLQGINFSAPTGGGGVVRTASTVVNNNYFTVQSVEPTLEGANRFVKQYVRPALNDLAASAV